MWAGFDNQQQQGDDPNQRQKKLHETFLQRQERLGRMPNSANRMLYPQASNLRQVSAGQGRTSQPQSFTGSTPGTVNGSAPGQQPGIVQGSQPPQTGYVSGNMPPGQGTAGGWMPFQPAQVSGDRARMSQPQQQFAPTDRQPQAGQPAPPPADRQPQGTPAPPADRQPQMGPPAPPPPPPAAPSPTAANRYAGYSADPNQAFAALSARYKQRLGKDIPQDQIQMLAQFAGYTGGNITPEQWDKAMWAVEHFSGDLNNPGVPPYQPPAAQQPSPQTPPTQAGPLQPNPGGFNPTPGWGVNAPPAYRPDTANLPEFQSTQFTQFQAPDQSGTTNKMQSLLDQILLSPDTLGEQQVNQMKSRAKETALAQAEQLRAAAGQNLASRGFGGGGMEVAANRAVDNQLLNDLITANREIDLEAVATNRQDRLNALAAGDSFLNSQLQRATQGYASTLAGQEAQAQDRRAGSDFGLRRWQAGEEAARAANDSEFRNAQFQFDQMSDDRKQRLAEFLGVEAATLDRNKFAEMQSQFKTATGLDLLKFLESTRQFNQTFGENQRQFNASLGENSRQFNANQGFNYAQLQQQGQQNLMNWLAAAYGI